MSRWAICLPISLSLLSACAPKAPSSWQGYAEGDFLALSAPSAGYLSTLDATRGARVALGDRAFTLESDPDVQAAAGADAKVAAAEARLRNLSSPRRQSEIASLEANVAAAKANLELAVADYARAASLAEKHLIAVQQVDAARTRRDAAAAAVTAATEIEATAREALGRRAEVAAARSDLSAAQADAEQRHWALSRKQVSVPASGEIADTYYRPGEWVAAGAPVMSLLPDGRRRIRFFVPEGELPTLHAGAHIIAHCDGCREEIRGTVDYIAPQAEYTPPVIYSRETRARLVFRVEAAPEPGAVMTLQPGQPLDVRLAP